MSGRILSDFRAVGTYDHTNGRVEITSDINGFLTATESATLGNGGNDPQGVNFYLKVVRADAVLNAQNLNTQNVSFETGEWSYDLSGGTVYFERQTTESSSVNSSDPVNFGADADGVEVYGAIMPNLFNQSDTRIIQSGVISSGTDYTNASTTTDTDLSDELLITQTDPSSVLEISYSGYGQIERTTSSGTAGSDDARARLRMNWFDGTTWTGLSTTRFAGAINTGAANSGVIYINPTFFIEVGSAALNTSGQWQIRLRGKVDFNDNVLTMSDTQMLYREVLRQH